MVTTQQSLDVADLGGKTKDELLVMAHTVGLEDGAALTNLRREELLSRIFQLASSQQALISSGILEVMDEGYGFLRQVAFPHTTGDVYISQSQIRRFGLTTGDTVTGQVRPPKEGERYFGLVRVENVNGLDPEQAHSRPRTQFEHLTPIFPENGGGGLKGRRREPTQSTQRTQRKGTEFTERLFIAFNSPSVDHTSR